MADYLYKYYLFEDGIAIKTFSEYEIILIQEGKLDVAQFFKTKEKSIAKLNKALKGRPLTDAISEPKGFSEKFEVMLRDVEEMKKMHNINL